MNETVTGDLTKEISEAFRRADNPTAVLSRANAITHFERLGLPGKKNEEYRFTPISGILEKNFTPNNFFDSTPGVVTDISSWLIPLLECNLIVFVNGQYSESLSNIISDPQEIVIKPLVRALEENAAAVALYFNKLLAPESDAFAALNAAAWQSGVFIHVPENTVVKHPVFILHVQDASVKPVVSQTRVLAIIEKSSEVRIVEKFNSIGGQAVFHSAVEEIVVRENSSLTYYKIQNDSGVAHQVGNTLIHQSNSSRVNTFTVTLDGQLIRNNLRIVIDGEGCESHFYGLYLLRQRLLADNHTTVDHQKPNSFSNELYKGIMEGNSKGIFNGKIYVRPHAQKTNAFQSNRNILISDTATVHTKPQLEIWADDVKCSHGCTSGQLDEEAIFYLQSRGISKLTARAMVLYAFAAEVLAPIKDVAIRTYLDGLISERLQNNN